VKVYRPDGTKYSEGQGSNMYEAISIAQTNFVKEFQLVPSRDVTVIEAVGTSLGWKVTLLELL